MRIGKGSAIEMIFVVGMVSTMAACAVASPQADTLTIHEWGTFTSLQDETGRSIGGINSEDEPLPEFVHNLRGNLIARSSSTQIAGGGKGIPFMVPSATMRLETPVLYFYPPAQASLPLELDVRVEFRGGWLTQFYPDAIVQAPGVRENHPPQLGATTVGQLEWRGLRIGGGGEGRPPETQSGVWLAPRRVDASLVTARGIAKPGVTESEKYLFYRGIAHLDAPLKVVREGDKLSIQAGKIAPSTTDRDIPAGWLADIREDGQVAFRELGRFRQTGLQTSAGFMKVDYGFGNLRGLRDSMHKALVANGLFSDEAYALLDTWETSYFKSPGLRLFYIVPQAWTDYYLPLTVSVPAAITRVMVARTEIVTPEQRKLIELVARDGPVAATLGIFEASDAFRRLGRFRDALMADRNEQQDRLASGAREPQDRYPNRERSKNGPIRDDRETSSGR